MSFTPNAEAAREAFAERVADAYLKTWQGFGFVGDEFNEKHARELGEHAAQYGFPVAFQPTISIDMIDLNDPEIFKALVSPPTGVIVMTPPASTTVDLGCGDGVVGD